MNKRLRAAMSELIKQNPAAYGVKTVRFSYLRGGGPFRYFPAACWATVDAARVVSCQFRLNFDREASFSSVQELSDAITELTLAAVPPAATPLQFRNIIFDDVKELERLLVVLERMKKCLAGDLTQLADGDSHVFSITTGWSLKARKKNLTFPE